jgi:hypothetical protein
MAQPLLVLADADPRTIYSMFFAHDCHEQDWYNEMKDGPDDTVLAEFYNLIRQSHLVARFGEDGGEYTHYLFQDHQGCLHLLYDDDAGVLSLRAFADKAAANAAFEQYIASVDFQEERMPWIVWAGKPLLEFASMDADDITDAMRRR